MNNTFGWCRGKSVEHDMWVEGYYVRLCNDNGRESHRIYTGYAEVDCGDFYPDWFEVDPATVGRYVGRSDHFQNRIFEGDVVRDLVLYLAHLRHVEAGRETPEQAAKYRTDGDIAVVEFCTEEVASCGCCYPEFEGTGFKADGVRFSCCEVLGNIHDDPGLIGG